MNLEMFSEKRNMDPLLARIAAIQEECDLL